MSYLPPFAGSVLKIERARKHIAELRVSLAAFAEGFEVRIIKDGETDLHNLYTLRFNKRPPDDIPTIIGDAVHNLRSALDLMTGDLARSLGVNQKEMKFPFAASEADLIEKLGKAPYSRFPKPVTDLFFRCGPYKGGNHALRGLHDLDIADKHQAILPTYVAAWGQPGLPEPAYDLMALIGVDLRRSRMPFSECSEIILEKGVDPANSLTLIDGPPEPLFPGDSPFPMDSVLETLEGLTHLVAHAVELFAAELPGRDNPLSASAPEDG